MTERRAGQPHIAAIGGVGGSGTRLGAALLQIFGYYIGDDLNEALDNLWFTLLFKRRSVLAECRSELTVLIDLFLSRMLGETAFTEEQRARVCRLAQAERLQHPQEWLRARAQSLLNGASSKEIGQPWGWKEPNTHVIIERFFEFHPDLRYIHFTRHPLDMALSANQLQLENWGPVLLDRDVAGEPRESLAYWCAAHRKIDLVMRRWPDRSMILDYNRFCAEPLQEGTRIASFLGAAMPNGFQEKLDNLVDRRRQSSGRFRNVDLTQFFPEDMSYVRGLGYIV
jgi:hypothetical protein